MFDDKNLPWFPCFPSKWLGALSAMQPMEALVFVVVCLRIYEVNGPCSDTVEALARRTGLDNRSVSKSLGRLFENKKLFKRDGGMMNLFAEKILADRSINKYGKNKHGWKKDQLNQQNDDAQLHLQVTDTKESKKDSRADARVNDWPTDFREQFWNKYPRKVAKAAAMRALDRVYRADKISWMLIDAALHEFAVWAKTKEIQYVKHPATWINAGCWDDELTKGEFRNGAPRQSSGGGFAHNLIDLATNGGERDADQKRGSAPHGLGRRD
jgi:hypothetical protein